MVVTYINGTGWNDKAMYNEFDIDELLAFAIKSIEKDNYVDALAYTKTAVNKDPDNDNVAFLLASIHAQLGLVDKAIAGLSKLCQNGCLIPESHFQLGLLHFVHGNTGAAHQAWDVLEQDQFKQSRYLLDFKDGLIDYEEGHYESCVTKIGHGLEQSNNPSLNKDFIRLTELAQEKMQGADSAESNAEPDNTSHVYLNAYKES